MTRDAMKCAICDSQLETGRRYPRDPETESWFCSLECAYRSFLNRVSAKSAEGAPQ